MENEHTETRDLLLNALVAVGAEFVADPFHPTGKTIYEAAGALAAYLSADLHGSVTADITRNEAVDAFAVGWAAAWDDMSEAEQCSRLSIMLDCLTTVVSNLAQRSTGNPYAPVLELVMMAAGPVAVLAGGDLPASIATNTHRDADTAMKALTRSWAQLNRRLR